MNIEIFSKETICIVILSFVFGFYMIGNFWRCNLLTNEERKIIEGDTQQ